MDWLIENDSEADSLKNKMTPYFNKSVNVFIALTLSCLIRCCVVELLMIGIHTIVYPTQTLN